MRNLKIKLMCLTTLVVVLASCSETNISDREIKSRIYIIDGERYEVTYFINDEGKFEYAGNTEGNTVVQSFLNDHKNTTTITNMATNESWIFRDLNELSNQRTALFDKHTMDGKPATLGKSTSSSVIIRFYQNANYGNEMVNNTPNKYGSAVTNQNLINILSTLIGSTWQNSYVFENSDVGATMNDQFSSIKGEINTAGRNLPISWEHFVVGICEHTNYGGENHFFIPSSTQFPLLVPNLQDYLMGWPNNWNDETSSYFGAAFYQ